MDPITIVMAVSGACALLSAITPNEHPNPVLNGFFKFINACGHNWGAAANLRKGFRK